MQTDDLIRRLSDDLRPVPARALERRLAAGAVIGGLATLVLVVTGPGLRPDLGAALGAASFWMKLIYALALGLGALLAALHLARPEATPPRRLWLALLPVAALAALAGLEMAHAPSGSRVTIWLGQSWKVCPLLILGLSLPIYGGLAWAFRSFAPTRLALTGSVIGLAAGGLATALYCLHCPENSASFVLTWYTLGMALSSFVGRLLGPRLLRW